MSESNEADTKFELNTFEDLRDFLKDYDWKKLMERVNHRYETEYEELNAEYENAEKEGLKAYYENSL